MCVHVQTPTMNLVLTGHSPWQLSSFLIYETTVMMMPSPADLNEQFLGFFFFFWSTCLKSKRFANVAGIIFVLVYTEASI